ncbi:hypothetical protein Tco_0993588 [Tanacetum coccineum]
MKLITSSLSSSSSFDRFETITRSFNKQKEDCEGVGGFIGLMVGNTKKQINKPRPTSETDIEAIFQEVKEKQEASDKAFEEESI